MPLCKIHHVPLRCPVCTGAAGGASTSEAKREAARKNGKRGGRPKMKRQWTSAAMECFGVTNEVPRTARALREHCEGCGFEVPDRLRDDPSGRVVCAAPDMVNWTGYAPRIAGDRWILSE